MTDKSALILIELVQNNTKQAADAAPHSSLGKTKLALVAEAVRDLIMRCLHIEQIILLRKLLRRTHTLAHATHSFGI